MRRFHALRLLVVCTTLVATTAVGLVSTATPASAFCRTGMTIWSNTGFHKVIGVNTTFPASMRTGLNNAHSEWNRAGSVLVYDPPRYDGAWLIFAYRGQHAYTSLMGSAPGIALTFAAGGTPPGQHSGGDLYLSTMFTWVNASQNISGGVADVQTVAVHEVGHFVGLAHPWIGPCTDGTSYTAAEMGSVMTTINTGTRRNLNSDDISGVTTIY